METSNEELIREWRKIDPLLEDVQGFKRFCDIRVAGGAYPLNEEDLFLTVEPPRVKYTPRTWCGEYGIDCIPRENADAYWQRNYKSAKAVRDLVADFYGNENSKKFDNEYLADYSPQNWPLHINDGARHLEWIKGTFRLSLTQKDFKDAWKLFEHKEWFDESGYYIRGWLAVAEALGIGEAARKALETTPYPHADSPQEEHLCENIKVCPIYHYREYLKVMPIEDIPDDVFNYDLFQSNCSYYVRNVTVQMFKQDEKEKILEKINSPTVRFKVKWKIRKMIMDYKDLGGSNRE